MEQRRCIRCHVFIAPAIAEWEINCRAQSLGQVEAGGSGG
jgi:hypothetical protein